MKPGSVIVDVAIDQGGCIETAARRPTSSPTYVVDGVVHYCVTNMPGAVPNTSTIALASSMFPYMETLASYGLADAIKRKRALAAGVNTFNGEITLESLAHTLGRLHTPLESLLR